MSCFKSDVNRNENRKPFNSDLNQFPSDQKLNWRKNEDENFFMTEAWS